VTWERIESSVPLAQMAVEDADWAAESPAGVRWLIQLMLLTRRFEETLLELKRADLIHGPVHTSIGQEAVAAGAAAALRRSDKIAGTHRAHHEYLAKALTAWRPPEFDPRRQGLTPEMMREVRVLLAEVMGLAEGCSGGRGGSMHLYQPAVGVIGTNAIVGGGVPMATGSAWADRMQGRDDVTVCFFGDGAVYQGVVAEACNLASLWRAPVVYVIENNQYAVGTGVSQSCSARRLCEVAVAFGMPGLRVDGMNALAVKRAIEEVGRRREQGWLPCVVEVDTYRYCHHAGHIPGSAFGYRAREEEERWRERDPIAGALAQARRLGILDEAGEQALRANAEQCVAEAVGHCTERSAGAGAAGVRESLWPDPRTLGEGLRDERLAEAAPFVEAEAVACPREIRYSDAIAEVTGRWLEKEPLAVVMGEEVANLRGGAYGATRGLPERFPDRVRNTPISEAGFAGLACGAAMNGMHPVVEIMFSSFVLVAADQLFNQIAQLGHIYGGKPSLPLVVRTRVATGLGYGAQHSFDPVALLSLFPGWRVFVPTTPFDYIGLFNTAMRSRRPCILVEHHEFYGQTGRIPAGPPDHCVAPGRAKVVREGRDVTAAAYGYGVTLSLRAAEQLAGEGMAVEVLDLRSVDDPGMDFEAIGGSIRKTGMLVTVEQAPAANSIGAKIAAEAQRRFYDWFDGPAGAVTGPDVPLPVSRRLERACLPTVEQVAEALRAAARREPRSEKGAREHETD
jgi:2-oxoisovalerate dehydrogenase E1 component